MSAMPTSTCIHPNSEPPPVGTCRNSHSSPNHSASQKTAPATPVGGLRRHHFAADRAGADSSTLGIAAALRFPFPLVFFLLAFFLPRYGKRIASRREVSAGKQQQSRKKGPDHQPNRHLKRSVNRP